MQHDDGETREFSRLDHNLARIHGDMINFDIINVDSQTGRYHCVATFADEFQHTSLRTNAQVSNALLCTRARKNKQQQQEQQQKQFSNAVQRHNSALVKMEKIEQKLPFQVDRSHVMRTDQTQIPAHLQTPNMSRMSLKDYSQSTPQRNRLLNGKLFTQDLLRTIDRAAIPDAMK